MRSKIIIFILLFILCLGLWALGQRATLTVPPKLATPSFISAPIIHTKTLAGTRFPGWASLPQPRVIVTFWASWCSTCMASLPSKIAYVAAQPHTLALVAINLDTTILPHQRAVKSLLNQAQIKAIPTNIWWLSDPTRSISYNQFQVAAVPETFILDASRTIIAKVVGPIELTAEPLASALKF
jgi:thiol-disulfide isomerase/thioredoxin